MNDVVLVQLRVLVESAVRPVCATPSVKRKMREELLAHVQAIAEEELKLGDEVGALKRTRERFGETANLTRQLQETVPAVNRIASYVDRMVGLNRRESIWRRALRLAVGVTAMGYVFLLPMMLVQGNYGQWLTVARLPAIVAPLFMGAMAFSGTVLSQALHDALYGPRGRSWLRVVGVCTVAWSLVPGTTIAWSIALEGNGQRALSESWILLISGWAAPLTLLILVPMVEAEFRRDEEWIRLELGDSRKSAEGANT